MARIQILDPDTGGQVSSCAGPDDFGGCPHVHADGTVDCAGLVLDVHTAYGTRDLRLRVSAGAPVCPLRTIALAVI